MNKRFGLFLLILAILVVSTPAFPLDYVPGKIIVKLKADKTYLRNAVKSAFPKIQSLHPVKKIQIKNLFSGSSLKMKTIKTSSSLDNIYKISIPKDVDILPIIEELEKDPNILYAEPDYIVKAFKTPNDTFYSQQWGLTQIDAPIGWDITTGSSSEIIAIIDTGVNYNHPDLSGKVVLGYDYVNGDGNPMDDNGHGTHVAGIAAAITNNSTGIAGTSWGARILAIKVLNSGGSGTTSNVSKGIKEAADSGAAVINLSLGQSHLSSVMEDACAYAYSAGVVIIAAAGNSGVETPSYPAAYSKVFAVAATDSSDLRSSWGSSGSSNYGTWIDVCAPGTSIYSTYGSGYKNDSGTSMSSPFVGGLAALIKKLHPTWSPAQIMAKIESTADNIDSLNPGYEGNLGTGRINIARALGGFIAYISSPTQDSRLNGTIPIRGYATGEGFTSYKVEYMRGTATSGAWTQIGPIQTSPVENGPLATWTTIPNDNGLYSVKLTVNTTVELTHTITVTLNNAPSILGASLGGPNPFNPRSGGQYTFYYNLASDARVSIYVFDLLGNLLWEKTESQSSGKNYVAWNGKNATGEYLSNGVYLYRIVYESGSSQALLGKGKILILN